MAADGVPWRQVLRRLPRATLHQLRRTDLPLHGAALTFYAALAVVPVMLVAGRLAALLVGEDRLRGLARSLEDALPQALDAGAVARTLIESAVGLGWVGLVVGVLPASLYGEGLRRACASLGGVDPGRLVGWRGRLGALPVVVVAPGLLVGVLAVTPLLGDLMGTGAARTALGTYIGLNVSWVAVSVVLAWVFVAVVPDAPPVRHAVTGAVATAAFVAGFLQGFVLFLSLPIDLGLPFGGLVGVGAVVAVLLWMWVLHLVVLVGWVATRQASHLRRGAAAGDRTYGRVMSESSDQQTGDQDTRHQDTGDQQTGDQQTGDQQTGNQGTGGRPGLGSAEKDPSTWTTGEEPATGPQRSYLDTLAREAGEDVPDDLTKAQASEMIDGLQDRTGRGSS